MTTKRALGTIEKVALGEVWEGEAASFTPWLAENMELLGDALGLSLEAVETEAAVGTFRLDILAQDAETERAVIIENQFGNTDHSHLGQLLTYAAGFQAGAVVWIAEDFRDEHRAALDYLNGRTGEDTQFFGVAVELWKIGDSRPAPHFRLVAFPNDWSKQRGKAAQPESERRSANRMFRGELIARLEQNSLPYVGRRNAAPSHLILERPVWGVRYAVIWHTGEPGVEMIIENGRTPQLFQHLESDKDAIESGLITEPELDESIRWEPAWRRRESRLAVYRTGDVYRERESWGECQEWMIRKLRLFGETLTPRLEGLTGLGGQDGL